MKKNRPVKKAIRELRKKWYSIKYRNSSPGSVGWLIKTEIKYGGLHTGIKRNKVSDKDPRSEEKLKIGGMRGGDRMFHHNYAGKYSEYLLHYVDKTDKIVLVEVGILKGTGLAIWSELFNDLRILGMDIDLGHIKNNMDNLKKLGAFEKNDIELHEFDQFEENIGKLKNILNGDKVDIFIDDGFHSNEAILNTLKSALPHLAEKFVYFIEDNKNVYKEIEILYPDFKMDVNGQLTVLSR